MYGHIRHLFKKVRAPAHSIHEQKAKNIDFFQLCLGLCPTLGESIQIKHILLSFLINNGPSGFRPLGRAGGIRDLVTRSFFFSGFDHRKTFILVEMSLTIDHQGLIDLIAWDLDCLNPAMPLGLIEKPVTGLFFKAFIQQVF